MLSLPSLFFKDDQPRVRLRFLAQTSLLGAGGGVGNAQQGANHTGADGIHQGSDGALGEDQVDRLRIDQDIENRSNHQPGNDIADDLDDVEGQDIFPLKLAFFNIAAFESKAEDEAGNTAGDDPAPPG